MALFNIGTSSSEQQSFVDPAQAPFEDFVRRTGQAQVGPAQQQIGDFLGGAGADIFGAGQGFLQGLGAIAGGQNPFLVGLQKFGSGFETQQAVDVLGENIGRNLQQNILPQIASQATGALQLGGGRQGVAEGLATQGAQQAFATGAAGLQLGGLQTQLGALQAGAGIQTQAGQAGLAGATDLFNLGLAPSVAQFLPLQLQAGLIGPTTVLGESESESFEFGFGPGGAGGGGTTT